MKKLLLVSVILAFVFTSIAQAQSKEAIIVSQKRYEQLVKLSNKTPKETALYNVDRLAKSSTAVLLESLRITPLLQNLYYRSIGESVDGVADVNVKKPTLDECIELSTKISEQALNVKTATGNIEAAAQEIKNVKNPIAAAKSVKSLDYSKDALSITAEESIFQVNAIASIIETIKTADNL